jgi:tetratricopeptide (TPR) repeat protein
MTTPPEVLEAIERAAALSDAGHFDVALRVITDALAVDPNASSAYTVQAWALENLGPDRLTDAEASYREAIRLNPGDLWAKEGLATVLRKSGRAAEAEALEIEVVDEVGGRIEDDHELMELLGWCQHRLGRHDEAVETFRRALEAAPEWLSVRFDLALALLCGDRPTEALAEYEAALRLAGSGRLGRVDGLVAVALDDLDGAVAERPDLLRTPETMLAHDLLRASANAPPPTP